MAAADARQLLQAALPMALRRIGIAAPHRHQRLDEGRGHGRAFVAARGDLAESGQTGSQGVVVANRRGQQRQVHFPEHIAALREVAFGMSPRGLPGQASRAMTGVDV